MPTRTVLKCANSYWIAFRITKSHWPKNLSSWVVPGPWRQIESGSARTRVSGFFMRTCSPTRTWRRCFDFMKCHPSAATLGVYRVPDPGRCGIAVVDPSGRIERFVEKPTEPPGNLAFSGILIGTQTLLEVIPQKRPADIGFDVLPRLAGQMFAYPIPEFLLDIGTMENYRQAQLNWPGV